MAERIHIKSPGEVAKMQKAGAVTAEILMEIGAEVQAGRTTREIDDIAREIFKKHKVGNSFYQYRGVPGQLCISIIPAVCALWWMSSAWPRCWLICCPMRPSFLRQVRG